MSDPYGFWQPVELIVDLFTKQGRRSLGGFLALALSGAAVMIAAVYLVTGKGPF